MEDEKNKNKESEEIHQPTVNFQFEEPNPEEPVEEPIEITKGEDVLKEELNL